MEGFDREHGIDKIRRMIKEIKNEETQPEPKNRKRPRNCLKKKNLYIIREK